MSTGQHRPDLTAAVAGIGTSFRWWALGSAALLTLSYLSVLGHVVDVVGGTVGLGTFVIEILGVLALAAALSAVLRVRYALVLGGVLLSVGLLAYLATVPAGLIDVERQLTDTVALMTGLSVLRMTKAGVWALGFAPAPVFVSWYFFLRRRYALGALVGGAALSFFILTGDADTMVGLAGAVGALGALGFGRLDHEGGSAPQRNTVIAVIIATLVVTTTVSLVPGGEAQPLLPDRGSTTVEASLLDAGSRLSVVGSISLSPEVRFTVAAEDGDYWRVGAYDRYTGQGWVRTGDARPYEQELASPPGETDRLRQTFRAEAGVAVMPAAWKPTRVSRIDGTRVSSMGSLQPAGTIRKGEQYTVVSARPSATAGELRGTGRDYPEAIRERFLQLPESTPDRIGAFTSRLAANASNPYDTAVVVERWLERNKEYSLDVTRPEGSIAASFLFEMEAGYCTYFATTMITMLRSQGIPARLVVGYTPGQQVDDDQRVVRGFDSHAWVEVYFPDHGWVRFDPTPAAPRLEVEQGRLSEARSEGQSGVDTTLSRNVSYTPAETTSTETAGGGIVRRETERDPAAGIESTNLSNTPVVNLGGRSAGATGSPAETPRLPERDVLLYGAILLAGAAVAMGRAGLHTRAYRELWLRLSPSGSPRRRVEGVYDRLEYLLEERYRPRRPDETPREYVDALSTLGADPGIRRLYDLYERARYSRDVTEEDAETAERLLRDVR